jgi:putative addiction module component (TIGR02574 family)
MSTSLQSVVADALSLSTQDRNVLIGTLVASVTAPLHPDWDAEIDRRLDDLEAGRAELIPADEVFAELEALLAAPQTR